MGYFKLLFCFFLLFPPAIYGKNICRASSCGKNTLPVRFPFRLKDQQPTNCRYPGFNVGCNDQGIVTIKLPQSEEFFVRSIDYILQEIRLYDSSGCLVNRLPKFNLSGSPFTAAYYTNFSILSCSSGFSSINSISVGCLSNLTSTAIAVPSSIADSYLSECQKLFDQPISVPRSPWTTIYELGDDIPLKWDAPDCRECESEGHTCGFIDSSSQLVKCLGSPGAAAKGIHIFGIICLSISFGVFSVAFLICFAKAWRMNSRETAAAAATAAVNITTAGLDENTIQSYKKVVLGESFRLPGGHTSDGTCPICLSEYNAEDTIKCMPECTHCFHANCIDEWLRLTGTCPICRITPAPSPSHATSL